MRRICVRDGGAGAMRGFLRDPWCVLRGISRRDFLNLAALVLILSGSPVVLASVVTAPLEWQAASIEMGLSRLKQEFLDDSISRDTEFVGAVLRNAEGEYTFTSGRGESGQDRVTFRIQRPGGSDLVGLWHTHGAHGPTRAVFSPTDAELVRRMGIPFYLITPKGEIRVLRPEHVERRNAGNRLKGTIKGTMARLPRGSHPGERLRGRAPHHQPPRGCSDVMKV